MIKIVPTAQIKTLDEHAIRMEGISQVELIERAAAKFSERFRKAHPYKHMRVLVFAGQGNNGADALAISCQLLRRGYNVKTFLLNPNDQLSPGCEHYKQMLLAEEDNHFTELIDNIELPMLTAEDILIDGLFGSGLNRPVEGYYESVIQYINRSDSFIVSIDIPSGLMGEDNTNIRLSKVVQANETYTFEYPKLAFLFPEYEYFVGDWTLLSIDLHPEAMERIDSPFYFVQEQDVVESLIQRNRFAHKGDFGHALLIAGSKGKMGAALLAASATLRSGAGLLTAHVPQRAEAFFQTALPEAMLSFDISDTHFTSMPSNINSFSAVAVGPGLGLHMESGTILEQLLKTIQVPLVLDADAINLLSANNDLLPLLPKNSILTPHPKEMDRLVGDSANAYERLYKTIEFAKRHQVCIILKGAYTATCTPAGNVYFNNCGNPGMATAGSGDVLTGILLGLLAQGYDTNTASVVGVFLHATAGDIAAQILSQESMIASDIVAMIGKAYKQIK